MDIPLPDTSPYARLRRWYASTGKTKTEAGAMLGVSGVFFGMMLDGTKLPGLPTAVALEQVTAEQTEGWAEPPIVVAEWKPLYDAAKEARTEARSTGTEG
jgi:hypothetical protein